MTIVSWSLVDVLAASLGSLCTPRTAQPHSPLNKPTFRVAAARMVDWSGKIRALEIVLDNPSNIFYSGQQVAGELHLHRLLLQDLGAEYRS